MKGRLYIDVTTFATALFCISLSLAFMSIPVRAQSTDSQTAATDHAGTTASQAAGLPTLPDSTVIDIDKEWGSTKDTPAFHLLPQFVPGSTDWSRPYADILNNQYDEWLAFKNSISDQFNLDFGIDYSFYPQWSASNPVYVNVFYPYATFRPFTDTQFGSGEINVVTSHQVYWDKQNTSTQAEQLGLITFANDWTSDNFAWSTLAYTHTFPGGINWLSFTIGQYNLFSFDPNEYAANAQTSFISYSFAQDATQTFPNAGFGGYAQVKMPDGRFNFAAGVQGGTNLNGRTLTTEGFSQGKLLGWGNAQWTPKIAGLGDGIYSLLIYSQPFVPNVSSQSTGISLSASQNLTDRYGTFLRINNATGPDIAIRTSYAGGAVWNNPIGRNGSDQLGLALGWNTTNHASVGTFGVRDGEGVTELFYKATIFKAMHVTPDVQVFWNPASKPASGPVAVFSLRTTVSF